MFKAFLSSHLFSDFEITPDVYPDIDNREYWDNFDGERFLKAANESIDFSWPIVTASSIMAFKKTGDREVMEKKQAERRVHLVNFLFAELFENKGRFIPQIVDGLYTTCEETYWGLSAHWFSAAHIKNIPEVEDQFLDLFGCETAEHLAMTVTLLKNPLLEYCPEIVDRVYYEINRRIKTPYLERTDFWWMGSSAMDNNKGLVTRRLNNWNPWIISNILAVFMLTETDRARLNRALEKMFTELERYFVYQPDDGGCDEGTMYWRRAGASLLEFVYQLKLHTRGKINFFDNEKLIRFAEYMKKAHIVSNRWINIADSHAGSSSVVMPLLFAFAKESGQQELMNFAAAVYKLDPRLSVPMHAGCTVRRFMLSDEFIKEIESYGVTYPIHDTVEYLPNLELAILRNGNFTIAATGGTNGASHNHNDVGSFSLYFGDEPVLVDVGIGTYTKDTFGKDTRYTRVPWTRGDNHNEPTVNGAFELWGAEYCTDAFFADSEKIKISFAGAYPKEAQLKSLERELKIQNNAAICTDTFEFEGDAREVSEVFMTMLDVKINGREAILGGKYKMSANVGEFASEFIAFNDIKLEKDWGTAGVNRITLNANGAEKIEVTVKEI